MTMSDTIEKTKVLIVEDDTFLRKILATKFGMEGFDVRSASDGEEALAMLRADKPGLLLTDLIIPKMNGFELLAEVRADPKLKDLPSIVLSNLGQKEDIQRALDLGALSFITKADNSINNIVSMVKEEFAKMARQ